MHSTSLCLALMASSVLGLRVNFQRFSQPDCPAAFHINTSAQHDVIIESNKGCHQFTQQVPFESYKADVVKGGQQMNHDHCRVEVFTSVDCTGDLFHMGSESTVLFRPLSSMLTPITDLQCSSGECGNPIATGYHGGSAWVKCDHIMSSPGRVSISIPHCHSTTVSSSSSCTTTRVKTVTAAVPVMTPDSTFSTVLLTPMTFSGTGCSLVPEATEFMSSAASSSASASMLARRSEVTPTSAVQDADELAPDDAEIFNLIFMDVMVTKMAEACKDKDK